MQLQKALRTVQHYMPGGRDGREALSRVVRRLRRSVHDPDFAALRFFPPGRLLLDVGANYGQSAASMRLLQPEANIISYEPNSELAAKIARLFREDPRIKIRPLGLADKDGMFTLYIPYYSGFPYPGLASLNRDEARSWLSSETLYFFRLENVDVKCMHCRIITLDSENLAPYFIKIDVQGAEFQMLQGARQTLSRHRPILLIESPGRDMRIIALLTELGYQEYEFSNQHFRQKQSTGTNSFFLTADKREDLAAGHAGLFIA